MPALSESAVSALLAVPHAGPRVAVYFRSPGGGRWKRVAVAPDHAAAVQMINSAGDWSLRELPAEDDGPGLFDEPGDGGPS